MPVLKQSVADGHYYIHRYTRPKGYQTWRPTHDGVIYLRNQRVELWKRFGDDLFLSLLRAAQVQILGDGHSSGAPDAEIIAPAALAPDIQRYRDAGAQSLHFLGMANPDSGAGTPLRPLVVRLKDEKSWTWINSAQERQLVKPDGIARWRPETPAPVDSLWMFGIRYPAHYVPPGTHPPAIARDVRAPVEILDLRDIGGSSDIFRALSAGIPIGRSSGPRVVVQVSENYGYGPYPTQEHEGDWLVNASSAVTQIRLSPYDQNICCIDIRGMPRQFLAPTASSGLLP
jgi:hypothetical protein